MSFRHLCTRRSRSDGMLRRSKCAHTNELHVDAAVRSYKDVCEVLLWKENRSSGLFKNSTCVYTWVCSISDTI